MQQRRPEKKAKSNTEAAKKRRNPTIKALAKGVGVSTVTIDKYIARGCPRTSVEAVHKWRSENIKAVAVEETDHAVLSVNLKRAELAERLECARGRKMKNDRLEAQLISREELERDVVRAFDLLEKKLATLPERVACVVPSDLASVISEDTQFTAEHALKELKNNSEITAVIGSGVERCSFATF